ncbi:aldo/keto reductase [Paeniglutamicibacter sp. NPDC012692]|uniref:aldo/keto reductase n=1 Tax=Paeniglutamicibacter sp. NPDC012692 TaxID=3364388 RepID=UPI0036BAB2E3
MTSRVLAGQKVNPLGYGAMNIVHGYSNFPTPEASGRLLNEVLDAGVNHIDTATLYGGRRSEELIGQHLKHRRDEYFLASKGGLSLIDGRSVIDGRPELLLAQVDASLQQLQTDRIDLYYLHRLDPAVPVEESVGALAQAVAAGKIGGIGLSEISAATLRKAHAVHPIDAVQNEYSLATRNPEIAILDACAELGTAFVAFSPLYRGYLSGNLRDIESLPENDIRHFMPRFRSENYPQNLVLVDRLKQLAAQWGTTAAALSLAWVLAQGDHVHAIPGTTRSEHLAENMGALDVELDQDQLAQLNAVINNETIHGSRYNSHQQKTVESDEF